MAMEVSNTNKFNHYFSTLKEEMEMLKFEKILDALMRLCETQKETGQVKNGISLTISDENFISYAGVGADSSYIGVRQWLMSLQDFVKRKYNLNLYHSDKNVERDITWYCRYAEQKNSASRILAVSQFKFTVSLSW